MQSVAVQHDFYKREKQWQILCKDLELYSLQALLESSDPGIIQQLLLMLLSFGEEALCMLFYLEDNQVKLSPSVRHHRERWEQEILAIVSQEHSLWRPLFLEDAFWMMEFRGLRTKDLSDLSQRQLSKFIDESLRSIPVSSGSFLMGAHPDENTEYRNVPTPSTEEVHRNFALGMYPVTQGLYEYIMGTCPSFFRGLCCPVENLSFGEALIFCNRLSQHHGKDPAYAFPSNWVEQTHRSYDSLSPIAAVLSKGIRVFPEANGYRLPNAIQWEYAARAGEHSVYAGSATASDVAWYQEICRGMTQPVGSKKPNAWGFYDMCGNVSEWVDKEPEFFLEDGEEDYIPNRFVRESRGGAWYSSIDNVAVSSTQSHNMTKRDLGIGLRILNYI